MPMIECMKSSAGKVNYPFGQTQAIFYIQCSKQRFTQGYLVLYNSATLFKSVESFIS